MFVISCHLDGKAANAVPRPPLHAYTHSQQLVWRILNWGEEKAGQRQLHQKGKHELFIMQIYSVMLSLVIVRAAHHIVCTTQIHGRGATVCNLVCLINMMFLYLADDERFCLLSEEMLWLNE